MNIIQEVSVIPSIDTGLYVLDQANMKDTGVVSHQERVGKSDVAKDGMH
jgi:hypothetical protein